MEKGGGHETVLQTPVNSDPSGCSSSSHTDFKTKKKNGKYGFNLRFLMAW